MQVTSLLLLAATTAIATAQLQECFNGQLRESNTNLLEYCYDGEWRRICFRDSQWDTDMSVAACTELGYSDSGGATVQRSLNTCPTSLKVFILSDCNEPGLTECTVTPSDSCAATACFFANLQGCNTANCTDGALRLVDGSTDREGRVEVCVGDRRWRTVCISSQELAGAVCSQLGYIFEGSLLTSLKSFPPGAFPEYKLDCTQLSNGTRHCSPVEQQCDIFVELGVVCKNDLYTTPTTQQVTTPVACTSTDNSSENSTTFIAGIGVLVALLLAVSVGWIVSCVILLRRGQTVHKQHVDAGTISTSNQSYTQQDINTQLYAEATPPDTTYSRLNRDDKQMEEIATYDYADPNQIRVECSQATNPPPVSGEAIVREEEFYIAEDHTYAAVNKKAKKKKKPKNAESDGEGESEAPPPFVSTLAEV